MRTESEVIQPKSLMMVTTYQPVCFGSAVGLSKLFTSVPLNDPSLGWDGTCKNEPVTPGVYTYRAKVMFLDDIPLVFTGTVTVLR